MSTSISSLPRHTACSLDDREGNQARVRFEREGYSERNLVHFQCLESASSHYKLLPIAWDGYADVKQRGLAGGAVVLQPRVERFLIDVVECLCESPFHNVGLNGGSRGADESTGRGGVPDAQQAFLRLCQIGDLVGAGIKTIVVIARYLWCSGPRIAGEAFVRGSRLRGPGTPNRPPSLES